MFEDSEGQNKIEFDSTVQKGCYQRIEAFIQERYSDSILASKTEPAITIRTCSASTTIYVGTLWEDEAVIYVSAIALSGAEMVPALFEKLLRENDRMGEVASFSINTKDEITLSASLTSDCSEKQLLLSISGVANTADRYDDIFKKQCDGARANE